MFATIKDIANAWAGLRAFKKLDPRRKQIVIYAEGPGYWAYFEGIYTALYKNHHQDIVYVTSQENDPIFIDPPAGVSSYYIGTGAARTVFFSTLNNVNILITTMPDLQSYHFKRSLHKVHYMYVHHSMVSTHMIYNAKAFDYFDSILCVGAHHIREIQAREAMLELPQKTLIKHGYGKLDRILDAHPIKPPKKKSSDSIRVIVAPSWGGNALLERHGAPLIDALMSADFHVVLRPHMQTRTLHPDLIKGIYEKWKNHPRFTLDENIDATETLSQSDIMISDWSGAALEFAFGFGRPVVFVDTPRKVRNSDYQKLNIEPLESHIRAKIGKIICEDDLASIGAQVRSLMGKDQQWRDQVLAIRDQTIFNIGKSGNAAASHIASIIAHKGG